MPELGPILFLPGDGIGAEVMVEVRRVIGWLARRQISFAVEEDLVGGAAYDVHGVPLAPATLEKAKAIGTVMFGAVGGPKYDSLPFAAKPERGLLALRKELDLFANLRPAMVFPALADASSLKRELVEGLDIMILRELTGGVYFGEPRGVEDLPGGGKRAVDTQVYTTPEIERDRAGRLRAGREAAQQGDLGREGQRHAHRRALAPDRAGAARPRLCRRRARPHVRRQLRHAAGAPAQAVRRHRHRQSVRRPPVRLRRHAHGLARHAALGLAGCRRRAWAAARPCTSRSTARPPTSPARASPTRSPACSASPCCCATRSTWARRPTGWSARSAPCWSEGYRTADIAGPE